MGQHQKAFTLIELLVVIAIIGILSSIVLSNLNCARVKARVSTAQGNLRGVVGAVNMCTNENYDILQPSTAGSGDTAGGNDVCSNTSATDVTWPPLPIGWTYSAGAVLTPGSVSFSASGETPVQTITCAETGCTTS